MSLELGGHKVNQIHSEYFVFAFVREGQLILIQDGVETVVHENELFILVPGRHRYSWWAQSEKVSVDRITFYVAGDWKMQASLTPAKKFNQIDDAASRGPRSNVVFKTISAN
ncbi:hypothetical protein [Secundilactobacillus collinoides]|uniref:hypothetical protein n=1 Tax=Secundilactobacillus collinoides TaxID=33960 RepID=UPI0006D0A6AD|nr:hypothetical protein [Secundilactobacillus collinoides]